MIWKVLKYILLAAISIVCVRWLVLFYYGTANVFTFLLFTIGFFYLTDRSLLWLLSEKWKNSNWRLTHYAMFFAILLAEFTARYVIGDYKSYSEENGAPSYYSPYRQIKSENFVRRFFFDQEDVGIYIRKPNSKKKVNHGEFKYLHRYDSLGLRHTSNSSSLATYQETEVIVGLGDSFTEGIGTPEDSTWVNLLEGLLQKEFPNSTCVNAGISGSDVFFELYKLERLIIPKFHPSVVVLAINSSDIRDVIIRGGNDRFVSKKEVCYDEGPWWEPLYATSYLIRQVVHKFGKVEWHLYNSAEYEQLEQNAVNRICNAVSTDFSRLAKEHHFKPILVFLPLMYELADGKRPFGDCVHQLKEGHEFTLIDMYQVFGEYSRSELSSFFWETDRHNTSAGYLLIAENVAQSILSDTSVVFKSQIRLSADGIGK